MDYPEFLQSKAQFGCNSGFRPLWIPDFLFDFQKYSDEYSIQGGRTALFQDCGLGKSIEELVWAENVVRYTNGNVLIVTPLAVSYQFLKEAEKFGIDCKRSSDGRIESKITVTNIERLHYFDWKNFQGVVLDESSILKSYSGTRRKEITEFMRRIPYRLLATATAAPNDYTELGTSSECLGYLGHMDMLNLFFKNDRNTSDTKGHWRGFGTPKEFRQQQWRFKGHAENPFWRWVVSWARAIRRPSDIGFPDGDFILPALTENQYVVKANKLADGFLFPIPAIGRKEELEERRRTLTERCEKIAELVNTDKPALVWCQLNEEGDLLEKLIRGSIQVAGSDRDEDKEEKLMGFAKNQFRVLVTKPKIGAWGLNLQNCSHVTFFPSHSFEQYYQGVRRCWRFGQKNPVRVDIVTTEGEASVLANLQRKAKAADEMFSKIVEFMNDQLGIIPGVLFTEREQVPAWLS